EGPGLDARGTRGGGENLVARQERILLDFGRRHRGLRAVVAVLGAEPALRVEQEVQAYAIVPVVPTHAIGGGELREQLLVGRTQHGTGVLAPNDLAGECFRGESVPIPSLVLVRHRFGCPSSV